MEIFTWRGQVSTSGSGEFAMFKSEFGDGYSQDIPNGLQNEKQKWSVEVKGSKEYVEAALAFIRARKGQTFQWRAPLTSALGYYKCQRYSMNDEGGATWVLRLEFEQGNV